MKTSIINLLSRLVNVGFTVEEANTLRRAEMTLHRWGELECGDGNDYASWCLERDETTGKPYLVTYPHTGKSYRRPVADRERGALRRVEAVCKRAGLSYYHQTDPRGCALYILRPGDVPDGRPVDSCYTNGIAVCAHA